MSPARKRARARQRAAGNDPRRTRAGVRVMRDAAYYLHLGPSHKVWLLITRDERLNGMEKGGERR